MNANPSFELGKVGSRVSGESLLSCSGGTSGVKHGHGELLQGVLQAKQKTTVFTEMFL